MVMLGQYIKGQECVDNCMLNSVGNLQLLNLSFLLKLWLISYFKLSEVMVFVIICLGNNNKDFYMIDYYSHSSLGPPIIVAKDIEEIFRKNQYYALIQDTWARVGTKQEYAQVRVAHEV